MLKTTTMDKKIILSHQSAAYGSPVFYMDGQLAGVYGSHSGIV